ncbi:MAG: hypothetical protein IMZ54_11725 [Acidobacteria bacterium]|nr:hypothetical protein [Acidobacteriota bacterium]
MDRIRMLKSVVTPRQYFEAGTVVLVPGTLDKSEAEKWVAAGLAEEDKLDPRRLETKVEPVKKGKQRA